jgi:hypothetical protein
VTPDDGKITSICRNEKNVNEGQAGSIGERLPCWVNGCEDARCSTSVLFREDDTLVVIFTRRRSSDGVSIVYKFNIFPMRI